MVPITSFVAVKDRDWQRFLSKGSDLEEVNFWHLRDDAVVRGEAVAPWLRFLEQCVIARPGPLPWILALCDRLEAQLTTTQTESRRLLEAVLHEAITLVA